jgi:hypothetical protein
MPALGAWKEFLPAIGTSAAEGKHYDGGYLPRRGTSSFGMSDKLQ